jgi:uncharacterized protein YwgA
MNASEFLLSVIAASGGNVDGRTLLQKRSYFVLLLSRMNLDFGFHAYYYGPYSSTLDGTLTQLKNLGFLEESSTGFGVVSGGFEMRRYDYRLSEDAKKILEPILPSAEYQAVERAVQEIRDAGNPDYMQLSIAAKAHYILQKQGKRMSSTELLAEAKEFNWNISEQSLKDAVEFLKRVGLATD